MSISARSPAQRLALAGLMLGVALGGLDSSMSNTALPAIAAALGATPAESIWVINAYQLAVAATLLPFAALSDRTGARAVFLGGLAFFTAASLLSALAPSLAWLVVGRVLQGLGSGALMSVNLALVRLAYPPSQLGRGAGINAMVVGLSIVSGPSIASLVLTVAPWSFLYGIHVPLGLLALACAWPALPGGPPGHQSLPGGPPGRDSRGAQKPQGFDPRTALLAALAFAALVFAASSAAQFAPWSRVLPAAALSLVCLTLLLGRQRGHPAPMLPVDLFRRPLFALSALVAVASFTTQGLAFVGLPFFFEHVLNRPAVETGFLMLPWALLVAFAGPVIGRLSERMPAGGLGGAGMLLLSAGMGLLSLLQPGATVADIVWRMALCGIGFGLFQAPNLTALMSAAPPERAGGASGVIAMARLLGQTSGAAAVALCFGLAGADGPVWALRLGVATAGVAALASLARLRAR